ncbi:MAG: phosphoribosylamine--glycine ligase [Pseudomonadota bacterium]|nr:phosphoribosylamine--glycine ligase [Pseudomonadota bacterium]MEC8500102.1 phosphoribosylamine--glycine ligase [Pseudomonadota bacterium]
MKVLVIGGGGREHALAWKLKQSAGVEEVLVAPGNAGTANEPGLRNVDVSADDSQGLLAMAQREGIGFTVVGPEVPLVAGLVDDFKAAGLTCFGPSKAAAQLEGSKAFSKDFLQRHKIPTAAHATFTDEQAACDYVRAQGAPIVVKADGLAAGKGVVVAATEDEALAAVSDMLAGNAFGEAGHKVVIEEFLQGEEASFICLCDGATAIPFASSQDHKARDDGDKGPNTGGMGAYSPAPVVTAEVHENVMRQVIEPTLAGMAKDGMPYVGFLYAGLMIDAEGQPKVIEFNCRFGDPEAQPVMMRLQSDLLQACQAAVAGRLAESQLHFDPRVALGVVMAAGGYPQQYDRGDVISGLDKELADTKIFHAGTRMQDGEVVTEGGRVLCVVGLGDNVALAQARAYERVDLIGWRNRYFRKDIGHRAIERE